MVWATKRGAYDREKYQERKALGLCSKCNNPSAPFIHCEFHRNKQRARGLAYRARVEVREHQNAYHKDRYRALRDEALQAYGGRCVCCGDNYLPYLQLDHVNGGGKAHRQENGKGHVFLSRMKEQGWPAILQVLCANCHHAKTFGQPCKPHPR